MTYRLHSFPFSNYCEKAQWLLDAAGLNYDIVMHLPGPHARSVRRLSGQTAVPVLETSNKVIAGSNHIAAYLEECGFIKGLIPRNQRSDILEWQNKCDAMGGVARATLFHEILTQPGLAVGILTNGQKAPWFSTYGIILRSMCPMLRRLTAKEMPDPKDGRARCSMFLDKIAEAAGSGYLVGDQFTLADLVACSTFFPMWLPQSAQGVQFAQSAAGLDTWRGYWADHPARDYVERVYREHRTVRLGR